MEMWKFKYLGVTVTNRLQMTFEKIKLRISIGNACYYSLEKILSSHLLSKKFKANMYLHIKLAVLYYQLYCMVVKLGLSS